MLRHLVPGLLILCANQISAQGTAADYERSDKLQSRFANKVLNEQITPGWIGNKSAFWFLKQLPDGKKEFILVEPELKSKRSAFDHRRLAETLGKVTSRKIDPSKLPFQRIIVSPDLKSFSFTFEGNWTCDLATYDLKAKTVSQTDGLRAYAPEEVLASDGGGDQTSIRFLNQATEKLKIFWLEDSGNAREYKVLDPGAEWSINTWETHFWLVTKLDGTRLAVYKPSLSGGTAILDGRKVSFNPPKRRPQSESPDGNFRLRFIKNAPVLEDLKNKTQTQIGDEVASGKVFEGPIIWSPDSKVVLFRENEPEESHSLNIVLTTPKDQFQPKLTTRQYLKPGDKIEKPTLCMYRLGEKKIQKVSENVFPNAWEVRFVEWTSDNKALFHFNQRGHQIIQLVELDISTNATRVLIDERSNTFLDWTAKSYFKVMNRAKEAVWQSERSGYSHLYLYDLESGKLKNAITTGNWVVRGIDDVDETNRQIYFRAGGIDSDQDPYLVHYCRVNFDGSGFTRLTSANGQHRIQYSPDKKYLIDTYSRADLAPIHEVRKVSDGSKTLDLATSDPTPLINAGFKFPKHFVAKGRDGKTDIFGLVYFPSNYDPAKKYPVVEAIYAGPHSAHVPKAFHTYNTAMRVAELGFIVVSIDGMGTSQRSKAFHDVCWKNIADAGFPDRKLWIKAAAKEIPSMDISRVGIFGTSAGGQNALHAIQLHSDLYKVAVADCGCYDNRMDKIWWNEQWMGWPIGPHYEEQSCRTLAPKTNGKLLLLLGENDTNVDPASTYQVVDALIKANKDFDFVVIPNVGHGAIGHPYGMRKLQDFLVRNLMGVEPRG